MKIVKESLNESIDIDGEAGYPTKLVTTKWKDVKIGQYISDGRNETREIARITNLSPATFVIVRSKTNTEVGEEIEDFISGDQEVQVISNIADIL